MDFYTLRTKRTKEGTFVYPDFVVHASKDLLVKGGAFHAIWDEAKGLWSRDEMAVARMVDADLLRRAEDLDATPLLMSSFESKSWSNYKSYIASLDDSGVELDQDLTFSNDPPDRNKYASRRLSYSLTDSGSPAWDEIVGTLYDPEEREKIEWCIGAIISGESKKIHKFAVLYGKPGTGKSTILEIIERLFSGYTVPFDAKALTSSSNAFALSAFKNNPLVAIQQDGDLSKIEDNTRLNSIVAHEILPINEKYKSEFYARAIAFLFLGTNEPVKITGSKSGIIRRLIDIHPTGKLIPNNRYHALVEMIDFELGAIAKHCLGVYLKLGKNHYSNYRPTTMMYETDVFYNFVENAFDIFYTEDGVTLDRAWTMYKDYCEDALIRFRLPKHQFRAELHSYFEKFEERSEINGQRVRSYFSGFKPNRFNPQVEDPNQSIELPESLSSLDDILADQPAQYASKNGVPLKKWDEVTTKLKDLDTSKLHYVLLPENHIVIDFDLKDENGNKSRERNLQEASVWPPTYAEHSQGGNGVHLHYIYDGPNDVSELASAYKQDVEVKTLLGSASLRRRVSNTRNLPIAKISSGLPIKEKPMRDVKAMANEKAVRDLIIKNLRKEIHPGTKPSMEFIKKILEDARNSGMPYDVSDLYPDIYAFAMDSSHHARYCMNIAQNLELASEELELEPTAEDDRIVFFDVEVFPNLFVVCWKYAGDATTVRMINPSAEDIDRLLGMPLVGFNCRRYDNHIMYAAAMGYSPAQLYEVSQRIISGDRSAMFGAAYDLSYTDIFDFSSVKQSLKKFEIELGIHHMELGLPWDEPVDESQWDLVAEYCCNDVVATEETFLARKADFLAREILARLSGLTLNHTTQNHTARILFGNEKKPQTKFIYTNLDEMFPGYTYDFGKSTYRGEEVGEGGYVYAEPGHHKNVALLDVASMHPTSIELLELFGPYTKNYSELKAARLAIKRGDLDAARQMLDGKLAPYLEDESEADALAYALKIVINIVYGLTSAKFDNPFRDPRNKDNIVAKRGALFMIDLKHAVREKGFTVAHIKTDSIKIPDATKEIIDFVFEFGRQYGYEFEHEATYEDFILVNNAVYIAKYAMPEKKAGQWEKVGAQFQHPYVYKKLLSNEEVVFDDLCETKNVVKGNIFIANEDDRQFVGRIGRFVPMLPGSGGGTLLRVLDEKDFAVTGTKGYEWMEAVNVQNLGLEDKIDYSYFNTLADKARAALAEYGFVL